MTEKSYSQMQTEYIAYCNKYIKPYLPEYEKMRRELVPITIFNIIAIISFILFMTFAFLEQTLLFFIFFITCFLSIFIMVLLTMFSSLPSVSSALNFNFENNLKDKFMRPVLNIFSEKYNCSKGLIGKAFEKTTEYKQLNIFNPYLYVKFDDTICLEHKNTKISIFEMNTSIVKFFMILFFVLPIIVCFYKFIPIYIICNLIAIILMILLLISLANGGVHSNYAPFKGVVIELGMNKNFNGHTFFHEKSKTAEKIPIDRSEYEPVNLESVDFMGKYNVYSTDQVEARYLLTTSMIERLNNLKLAFNANFIRGSFKDNKLILAIDTGKDMFAMGSDFKESNTQTFIDFFNEITSVMKIVDQLKLDEKTGL